jgi:hypothetical protein
LLPDVYLCRVVPTKPANVAWPVSLQHTEPYLAACEQITEGFVRHVPMVTQGIADGPSIEYTCRTVKANGYHTDPESWKGEANSCCPPNPRI